MMIEMTYIHAKCPKCGAEAEGTFQMPYFEVKKVTRTLKGFDYDGKPIFGSFSVDGWTFDNVTCVQCGYIGHMEDFKRKK